MRLNRIDVKRWVRGRVYRSGGTVLFDLGGDTAAFKLDSATESGEEVAAGAQEDALVEAIVALCEELDEDVIAEAMK